MAVFYVYMYSFDLYLGGDNRASSTDFGMGGYQYPPIGGGPKGGDKGLMGGDWRVIRDKIKGTKKISVNL